MYQGNQSAILPKNNGRASSSRKTKHLNISYFFITDRIKKGELKIEYCPNDDMVAGFYQTSARQELHTIQKNYKEPERIKCTLTKECVENQLLYIFYIMRLHHDLKFNHTYIFSHFIIRDGNQQLLIISILSHV